MEGGGELTLGHPLGARRDRLGHADLGGAPGAGQTLDLTRRLLRPVAHQRVVDRHEVEPGQMPAQLRLHRQGHVGRLDAEPPLPETHLAQQVGKTVEGRVGEGPDGDLEVRPLAHRQLAPRGGENPPPPLARPDDEGALRDVEPVQVGQVDAAEMGDRGPRGGDDRVHPKLLAEPVGPLLDRGNGGGTGRPDVPGLSQGRHSPGGSR